MLVNKSITVFTYLNGGDMDDMAHDNAVVSAWKAAATGHCEVGGCRDT